MALSFTEFEEAVLRDSSEIDRGIAPSGLSVCSDCATPLQESITGHRPGRDGSYRCSDCFFEALGDEIDAHPLGAVRPVRGA